MVEIHYSVSIRKERWDGGAGTVYIYICRKENSKFYQHTYLRIQAWIFHDMPIDESPLCCLNWTNELLTTSQVCDFKCYFAVLCSLRVDAVGWLAVVIAAVFLEPMMISSPLIGANIFKFNSHLNIRIQGTDEWISNVFQQFTSRTKYFQLLANVKTSQRSVILLMLSYSLSFFFIFLFGWKFCVTFWQMKRNLM